MSEWVRVPSPKDKNYGDGWCREMDRCYCEGRELVVLSRKINTSIGVVEHMAIRNADNTDIPWATKQKIKNELAGRKRTAIEVFPDEDRLIDVVGMYHLWVLPEGFELPFGIHPLDKKGTAVERKLLAKYTVVGNFRQVHKDCEGECLTGLFYEEAKRVEAEWRKDKKYKEVFCFKEG